MVGSSGLEPPTSRLSGARSNQLSYEPVFCLFGNGGDERVRTAGLLLARQALSQLSYTPALPRFGVVASSSILLFQGACTLKTVQYLMNEAACLILRLYLRPREKASDICGSRH